VNKISDNLITIGVTKEEEQKSISNNMSNPKILLVSYLDLPCSNFPQGIASISAMLKREGYSVTILDFDLKELKMKSEGIEDIPIGIEDFDVSDFDVVCFGLIAGKSLLFSLYHIERIKSSTNKIVIAGGPLASSAGENILNKTKADFICLGEGEEVMVNFMNALKEKNYDKLNSIPGIGYKHNGKITINPSSNIEDLDKLPMPDYGAFDMETYLEHNSDLGDRHIDLFTSRGCPFNCQFCYHERRWNVHSPINIVEHITYLKKRYNIKSVMFRDDNFTHNKQRVFEFCELVKPLDIKWTCLGRADTCMDEHLMTKMKEAGCAYVRAGLETGSERMLKVIIKGHTLEHSWKMVECLTKIGMPVKTGFMFGMPTETLDDAKKTLKFIKKIYKFNPNADIWTYYFTPRPNTPWYNQALEKGMKEYSLKDYSEMDKFTHPIFNMSNMTKEQVSRMLLKSNILRQYYTNFRRKGGFKRFLKFITFNNAKILINRLLTIYPNNDNKMVNIKS